MLVKVSVLLKAPLTSVSTWQVAEAGPLQPAPVLSMVALVAFDTFTLKTASLPVVTLVLGMVKLVSTGAATAVTVCGAVMLVPALLVTVQVNVVVCEMLM